MTGQRVAYILVSTDHKSRDVSGGFPEVDQVYARAGEVGGVPGCQTGVVLARDGRALGVDGADRATRAGAGGEDVCVVGGVVDVEGQQLAGVSVSSSFIRDPIPRFPSSARQQGHAGAYLGRGERGDHQVGRVVGIDPVDHGRAWAGPRQFGHDVGVQHDHPAITR